MHIKIVSCCLLLIVFSCLSWASPTDIDVAIQRFLRNSEDVSETTASQERQSETTAVEVNHTESSNIAEVSQEPHESSQCHSYCMANLAFYLQKTPPVESVTNTPSTNEVTSSLNETEKASIQEINPEPKELNADGKLNKLPDKLEKWRSSIESASSTAGAPASLIAAVIWQESRGKSDASSTNPENKQSDTGLMQVNPATYAELQQKHTELQGKTLADLDINILAGAFYLSDMAKQFDNNWRAALRAYNSGPGCVNLNNLNEACNGTDAEYVDKVMEFKDIIEKGGDLPA